MESLAGSERTVKRVLVSSRSFGAISQVGKEILESEGFELLSVPREQRPLTEAKMTRLAAESQPEVILCGAEPIGMELLNSSRKLRLIMKHGVGVDNIDMHAATSLSIAVANAPGTNTEGVADLTLALMLDLLRGVCRASASTKTGGWERFVGHELGALTVGVVGTGRIGAGVVRRLSGFGPKILAFDVVQQEALISGYGVCYVSLEELLSRSDLVTLHVPLIDQTRGMIGASELSLMKPEACLINAARGELVDEQALFKTLKEGGISAAALDVFSTEPPQDSPLLTLDNVLATPHIAAYTFESMDRMGKTCAEIIVDVMAGKTHKNILNPEVLQKH
jgi:D-3-phosphoglycerate dehydrogenase